jgi:endonuclease YncB( thermonuclease family)
MRKLFSLLTALVVTATFFLFFTLQEQERQNITIARFIDGDTFVSSDGGTYRLSNINAPEKGTRGAEKAINYVRLLEGRSVEIATQGVDKYGRTLARIYAPEYVNRELVASGFAVKFLVNEQETKEFAAAEEKAIAEQLGIWKHSPHFGCIQAEIDEQQEFVVLNNACDRVSISDWTLRDESRKQYVFNARVLARYETVVVYSGKGSDNATAVFWGSATPIWNNERDTLYLLDADGRIVNHVAYGY